ncbi:unnamed protein product [Meloidogyne enterolobii]|uniref:Uncharacterized protein n=1 Tax=Meloidogyne enterolobii TaxID=390850 RepID=A0ACB1AXC4_MELEN
MLTLMLNIKFSDIPLAANRLISVFRQITSKILITHLTFTPKSAQIPLSSAFPDNTLSIHIVFLKNIKFTEILISLQIHCSLLF